VSLDAIHQRFEYGVAVAATFIAGLAQVDDAVLKHKDVGTQGRHVNHRVGIGGRGHEYGITHGKVLQETLNVQLSAINPPVYKTNITYFSIVL